jgi:hypothetical protein
MSVRAGSELLARLLGNSPVRRPQLLTALREAELSDEKIRSSTEGMSPLERVQVWIGVSIALGMTGVDVESVSESLRPSDWQRLRRIAESLPIEIRERAASSAPLG